MSSVQVKDPEAADKLAVQNAMTALKLSERAVPDSNGSQHDQIKIMAKSTASLVHEYMVMSAQWESDLLLEMLCGLCSLMCDGVRLEDLLDRNRGRERYTEMAVADEPLQMCTGVPPAKSMTPLEERHSQWKTIGSVPLWRGSHLRKKTSLGPDHVSERAASQFP